MSATGDIGDGRHKGAIWLTAVWRSGALSFAMLLVIVVVLHVSGALNGLNRALMDLRFQVLAQPASGQTVIVEIEPKSLRALGAWPWPRTLHATVIETLGAGGAQRIGVDIDFSSPVADGVDEAIDRAVKSADAKVVLPVFKRWASSTDETLVHSAPPPTLAKNARLGSVNVTRAADGLVRRYDRLHRWQDGYVAGFAAEVSALSGADIDAFAIDFAIRPQTIPRLSFVDVLNGTFEKSVIAGKYVIIGATAPELGDELPVPLYGMLSGPEIQALATETLIQGRAIDRGPSSLDLAVAILILLALLRWCDRAPQWLVLSVLASGTAVLVLGPMAVQAAIPLDLPTGTSLVALTLGSVHGLTRQFDTQAAGVFMRTDAVRERRALFEAVVESNADGIVVSDESGRIRYINPTAASLLGRSLAAAQEGELQDVLVIVDEVVPSPVSPTGAPATMEVVLLKANGEHVPVEMVIRHLTLELPTGSHGRRHGPRQYVVHAFRDIAQRKRAEAALVLTAERAMEADRMKSEFIANMSHELRTPLNAIIGFSEVIKQEMFGPLGNEKYRSYSSDIHASGTHLLSLIGDLLEVSKITAGKVDLDLTELDLERIFTDILRIVRGYPGASKLVLIADVKQNARRLIADDRSIRQILLNLLSNAIKFTAPGGHVKMTANGLADGGLEICVEDDGIGIPPAEIPLVTKAFHQVDSPAHRRKPGTGLGLHIVQRLSELLGGELSVSSAVSRGTRIRITFPSTAVPDAGNIIHLDPGPKNS